MSRPINQDLFDLVNCLYCGAQVRSYKSARAPKKYCSMECRSSYARAGQSCEQCGGEITVPRSHHRKYCSVKCRNKSRRLNLGQGLRNEVVATYIKHAGERGLEWDLNDKEVDDLFSGNCCWCGIGPSNKRSRERSHGDFIYNGIDRVDNLLGYTASNTVSCCFVCNSMKRDFSKDIFIEKALLIAKRFGWQK